MKKHQESQGSKEERIKPQLSNILLGSAIVIYALCTFFTLLHHEPWRDEAYAWLIARDANLIEFFRLRAYDLSPSLWYLILMPFAKLGFPYLTMSVIHWLLAVAAAALVLWRSPFSPITKLLFIFSYFMFWEYVVSVRVYTVGILLLFILAHLYPQRFKRPLAYGSLIALLFSANMHVLGLTVALGAAFAVEAFRLKHFQSKKVRGALLLMGLGALALYLQVGFQPADAVRPETHGWVFNPAHVFQALVNTFFVGVGPANLLAVAASVMLALVFWGLATQRMPLLIFLGHTVYLLYAFANTGGGIRQHGLLLIGFLFCLWISQNDRQSFGPWPWRWASKLPEQEGRWRTAVAALNFSLLVSLPFGLVMHRLDYQYDFSGGKAMAKFIAANRLEQYPIAAHRDAAQIALLPYLPGKQLWYVTIGAYGTYYRQNQQRYGAFFSMTYADALKKVDQAFPAPTRVLILLDNPLEPGLEQQYQLLHKVDATVFGSDERFYLYARL